MRPPVGPSLFGGCCCRAPAYWLNSLARHALASSPHLSSPTLARAPPVYRVRNSRVPSPFCCRSLSCAHLVWNVGGITSQSRGFAAARRRRRGPGSRVGKTRDAASPSRDDAQRIDDWIRPSRRRRGVCIAIMWMTARARLLVPLVCFSFQPLFHLAVRGAVTQERDRSNCDR